MKIKALKTFRDDRGNSRRGDISEVADALGNTLVARGLAEALSDTPPEGSAVEIPADWAGLHHFARIALAKRISGEANVKTERANEIISQELASRG